MRLGQISLARAGLGGALLGATLAVLSLVSLGLESGGAAAPAGTLHRITIQKFAFVPANLTIKPGDSIEWVNLDFAPHTATQKAGAWDTGKLIKGQAGRMTLSAPGDFAYICAYHPNMRGTIRVSAD